MGLIEAKIVLLHQVGDDNGSASRDSCPTMYQDVGELAVFVHEVEASVEVFGHVVVVDVHGWYDIMARDRVRVVSESSARCNR